MSKLLYNYHCCMPAHRFLAWLILFLLYGRYSIFIPSLSFVDILINLSALSALSLLVISGFISVECLVLRLFVESSCSLLKFNSHALFSNRESIYIIHQFFMSKSSDPFHAQNACLPFFVGLFLIWRQAAH